MDNHGVFTTVDAPGATETELLGLNDHGIAVGLDMVNGVTHGVIYNTKTDTFTTLDDPNASSTHERMSRRSREIIPRFICSDQVYILS